MISAISRMSQTGFFISFEGSEGCGKSTQIRLLVNSLSAAGKTPLLVREPGSTPIGESLRHLLQHSAEGWLMEPETELLLFAASRAQLVRQVILPALEAGQIVISDRFLDSTTVYQGVARRIPTEIVDTINRFAAGPRLPDVTFLLDMDSAEAHRRLIRRPDANRDRMEELPPAFYEAVRGGYLELAAAYPDRIRLLDATKAQGEIARDVRAALCDHAIFKGIGV
ncbi:MAG: dTMP kinase [Terrimicrobiaceae bacterium]